jgi:hypothetical protein
MIPKGVPNDRGSCTEELCETERLTHSSELVVGAERPLPTITVRPLLQKRHLEFAVCTESYWGVLTAILNLLVLCSKMGN